MKQVNIFDILEDKKAPDYKTANIKEVAEYFNMRLGFDLIPTEWSQNVYIYQPNKNTFYQFYIDYDKTHIIVDYGDINHNESGPMETIEEAIEFFERCKDESDNYI